MTCEILGFVTFVLGARGAPRALAVGCSQYIRKSHLKVRRNDQVQKEILKVLIWGFTKERHQG